MKSQKLFSGMVQIEIEGPRVLEFVECYSNYVEYSVIGFHNQVILRDFRECGRRAIEQVLIYQNVSLFPKIFNGSAYTTIFKLNTDTPIIIELKEPINSHFDHLLWIVVGIDEQIPLYDYRLSFVQPLENNRYSLIALVSFDEPTLKIDEYYSCSPSAELPKPSLAWTFSS